MADIVNLLLKVAAGLAAAGLLNIIYSMVQVRMLVRRVNSQHGIDILPHSFLFGHLALVAKMIAKSGWPKDVNTQWMPMLFLKEYPELASKGIMYIDTWPIVDPCLFIYHPDLLQQLTDANFPKARIMVNEFRPVTGAKDLVNLEGQEWKKARAMFNPGFSARNLTSLLPEMVEEAEVFREKLRDYAKSGEVFKLEALTTHLAVDVIGRAVLGARLNSLNHPPPIIDTLLAQIGLLYNQLDFTKLLNPMRYIKLWVYRRRFRKLITPYILDGVRDYEKSSGPKTIVQLALKERMAGNQDFSGGVPEDFLEQQVGHFWTFLFGGHDTTAISLAFTYYLLARNPDKLAKVREEHDRVLGSDPKAAAARMREDPSLVNQLQYTLGALKESLRLWGPVTGGVRAANREHYLVHPKTGERFPTYGFMTVGSGVVMHRLEEYWPRPTEFLPERWLAKDPEDPLYTQKNAFRPFEAGPRNCIGQELVSMEIRLTLALTAREFDIIPAFADDGPELFGEKAYTTYIPSKPATAHAKDEMPVRIRERA